MLKISTFVVSLLAVSATAVRHDRRDDPSDVTQIYAYGAGIRGLPIEAGSDGHAYVSSTASSDLTNLTWSIARGGQVPWNVTANSTAGTPSTPMQFYIIPGSSQLQPAGFISSGETAPSGATTLGFTLFGSDVMFLNGGKLEASFWAHTQGGTGTWAIVWNADGKKFEDGVPVTLKSIAPPPIDKM